ncbi:MAG: C40 family peptidase [Gemmatimonadales bacterium]
MRWIMVGCAIVGSLSAPRLVAAQGIEGQVGRFYQEDGWTMYRVGLSRPLAGPFSTTVHGDYWRRVRADAGAFGGVGLDLSAFRGGGAGPYLIGGIGAGLGSAHSQAFSSTWTSWSAGLGYELAPAEFLRVGAEGRWRHISLDRREGFEFAAGLSINLGGGGKASRPRAPADLLPTAANEPPAGDPLENVAGGSVVAGRLPTTSPPVATPTTARPLRLADSVVATATSVMGRPYEYGGTGADGGGFDCSGLIQYAYAHHGISLPRTSAEQAREGKSVKKDPTKLRPGDLLTFSNRGGPVTHIGLYVGDGRFIHSATRGVQVSALSADDPYGRWWYTRWVGVRRILP